MPGCIQPLVLGSQRSCGASLQILARGCCSTEGKCDRPKPISRQCNLSMLTSAEGEYSAACQITQASHSVALSGWRVLRPVNPVQLNLLLLLQSECYSSFMSGCTIIWPLSHSLPFSLLHPKNSLSFLFPMPKACNFLRALCLSLALSFYLSHPSVPHSLILCSSSFFSPSVTPCYSLSSSTLFLCHFLAATCSSFSNLHHSVCSRVSSLFFVPNHFARLMFQGAGTLTGDMEVHLPRQEQAWRHKQKPSASCPCLLGGV